MADKQVSKNQADDILVVDDTIDSLRLLTEILSREGYRVRPADRPRVALESALAHQPSLILLDVRMPEMSGYEACLRLKEDVRTQDIPIIFVSALQDVEDRVKGFEAGGVDFISKPIEELEVLARVRTHLQLSRMQLNLEELVTERTAELVEANEALKTEIAERKRVEQKLRENEESFRATFEQAAVGIGHVSPDGRFLRINQKFCDIVGKTREEMQALTVQDITHPDDLEADLKNVQLLLDGEIESYSMEKRYLREGGEMVWVNLTVSLLRADTGEPSYFISVVEDISERKLAEEQYRTFFTENVSPVFWTEMKEPIPIDLPVEEQVNAIFREAYVKDVSESAARMYGLTREELIGEKAVTAWSAEAYQERNSDFHQFYQDFVRSGYTCNQVETSEPTKEGKDLWLLISLKGVVENGRLVRIWGSQIDITERKLAEESIHESEAKYRTLVEQANDGIVVIQDEKIVFANARLSEITGYSLEEFDHSPFTNYLPADELPTVMDMYRRREEAATLSIYESAIQHKDGARVNVEFNAGTTLYDGKPAVLVIIRDLTQRLRTERELQASQNLLNLVVDHLPALVAYVDRARRYQLVNQGFEDAYGKPLSAFIGKHVREILGPEGYAAAIPYIAGVMAGEIVSFEGLFTYPNQKERWMQVNYVPDIDPEGEVQGYIALIHDITGRVLAEQQILEYQERLKSLASQLTIAEERERSRIAAELHDHIGQSLALARVQLFTAQNPSSEGERETMLEAVSQTLLESIQATRGLIFDLSSPLLNEIGLGAAISEFLEVEVNGRHGIETTFSEGEMKVLLPEDKRAILFRNVRELLNNVIRHANASQVNVRLEQDAASTKIFIQDDGCGFNPETGSQRVTREVAFGLFSIQERMSDLGGTLDINSQPGEGTEVILAVPHG